MEPKKKEWKKPELIVISKGELGETVLNECGLVNGEFVPKSGGSA